MRANDRPQRDEERYLIDKSSDVPLYEQLACNILGMIQEHTLRPGDMLPTEAALCALLDISRPTVRQALGELVTQGYLSRVKGKGTFVAWPASGPDLTQDPVRREIERFSARPLSAQVLSLERAPEPPKGSPFAPGEALLHLRRLLFDDGDPVALMDSYLPQRLCGGMTAREAAASTLYEALERVCGVRIDTVRREAEAVAADTGEAALLETRPYAPLLLVRSSGSAGRIPAEYSLALFRGDRVRFGWSLG